MKSAEWRLVPAICVSLALHALGLAMVSALIRHGGVETIGQKKYPSVYANLASPFQRNTGWLEARLVLPGKKLGAMPMPASVPTESESGNKGEIAVRNAALPYAAIGRSRARKDAARPEAAAPQRAADGASPVPMDEPGKESQVAANPRHRSAFAFSFPQVLMGGPNDKAARQPNDFQPEHYYRQMMQAQAMRSRQEELRQLIARFYDLLNERFRGEETPDSKCLLPEGGQLECEPSSVKAALKEQVPQIAGLLAAIRALGGRTNGFSITRQDGRLAISLLEAGKQEPSISP